MLNASETIKSNYERLKKIKKNNEYTLNLLILKIVIDAIKINKDDDGVPWY